MAFLDRIFFDNTARDWLLALLIAGAVLAALQVLRATLIRYLSALADRTHNELDDLAADLLRRTRSFFLVLLALFAGSHWLELLDGAEDVLLGLLVIATGLQVGLWGNAAIAWTVRRQVRRQVEEDAATATTMQALGFLGRLFLWVVLLLVVLDNLGYDITALIAGLGVGGVAVALAVQNILGDLLASLSIVLDKPFVIGDFIIVGDSMGTVEHVGLKTTRVRSLSGEQLVFANGDLLSSRIRNFKRMYERRVVFAFGVVYQTPHETLRRIPGMVREMIEAQEKTRFDRAHFKSYGASSLDFEVVYYVQDPEYNVYMDIQQDINLELFRRFEADGIDFAYPTQTLYIEGVPAESGAGRDA